MDDDAKKAAEVLARAYPNGVMIGWKCIRPSRFVILNGHRVLIKDCDFIARGVA